MTIEQLNKLTAETILAEEIFEEVFSQEDEILKARMLLSLTDRAEKLKVKAKFLELVRAYKRVERDIRKKERGRQLSMNDNWTNFSGPYNNMYCGSWIAGEDGIYAQTTGTTDVVACHHPIMPLERLRNLETGDEQIKIAYKRNNKWTEIIVPKTMIASANKIISLSGRGILVNSENAKYLVRYLTDIESYNDNNIDVRYSTSKLGWIKGGFIPYDTDIIFDGNSRFRQVYESIGEHGVKETWYDHVRQLRRTGKMEIKFMLAASFASVLVGLLGGLPFVVDLWGETEGGKSVTLMLAASVWADPDESRYIGDFKSTEVLLEVRADLLNHLPMMLDDTSKVSTRIRNNFEGFVYDLCSGKGKSRSNKDLGMNRENHWKNCILTNGERPLNSYVNQGGAINRIIEIECGESVYQDPQYTADLLKKHYGFAGRDFINTINEIGLDEIKRIQQDFQKQLFDIDKMQKQSISLSIVLTADKIVTDYLFKDNQYISIEDAKKVLVDKNELSDNERCYQFILGEIAMNKVRFQSDCPTERWGAIQKGYAIIIGNVVDNLCKKGGFSKKSFLNWADKKGLLETQGKYKTKVKNFEGHSIKCVFLKIEEEKTEFVSVDECQERLPFN